MGREELLRNLADKSAPESQRNRLLKIAASGLANHQTLLSMLEKGEYDAAAIWIVGEFERWMDQKVTPVSRARVLDRIHGFGEKKKTDEKAYIRCVLRDGFGIDVDRSSVDPWSGPRVDTHRKNKAEAAKKKIVTSKTK